MKQSMGEKLKEIFDRPSKMTVNLMDDTRPVRDCVCIMCGQNRAEVLISNPNGEPCGGVNDGCWDVCKDCKDFAEWGIGKSFEAIVELGLRGSQ